MVTIVMVPMVTMVMVPMVAMAGSRSGKAVIGSLGAVGEVDGD